MRLSVEAGRRLFAEGRGRQFVEGGVRPSAKGRNCLSREGGSYSLRQGSPSAKRRTRPLSKVEGSCSLKKDGWQPFVERGRMPAREGEDASTRGRMPAREREDASVREGGCRPFIERGRSPFIERGRRPLCVVVGGKNNEFPLVGKFKVQRCRNFKLSGLEQVAAYNLKLFTFKKFLA